MTSLEYWSLTHLSETIRRGSVSSHEATRAMLERIETHDGKCQAYITVLADRALEQARQADDEIGRGLWRGPLHGVPIAVKDLCFTKAAPTTAGMSILKDWVPSYDATVVERLEGAGAVLLGKLKTTEGATGNHHPTVTAPRNPWHSDYWCGVSSSGSGVAVAAGLCFGALGSDTGGSIRVPCACCGVTGIKPTWGRVSRHGVFPLAESLDHVGPMARSAADAAAMLGVIAGYDPHDPTSLDAAVPNYLAALQDDIRGIRIGIAPAYSTEGASSEVVAALDEARGVFAALGAEIKSVNFPAFDDAVAAGLAILCAEAADAHQTYYPAHQGDYGAELTAMIEAGLATSALQLSAAGRERRAFSGQVNRLWRDVDLLLIPAMPMPTPTARQMVALGESPTDMAHVMRFTMPFDLTGSPTITLPGGVSPNGLPLAIQLVGRHLSEDLLCRAGHAFQRVTDWHTRHPAI